MAKLIPAILTILAIASPASAEEIPLVISGGHEIGDKDHGRPCNLIAAALGVKTDVFREAFSGVTPAKGRGPTGEEAKKNKEALMKVLEPHGVTNDRLDEVSNYYRYVPQKNELWKHKEATAHAVIECGKIKEIVVTEPGSGYNTPPKVTIKGMEKLEFAVTLEFDKDLKKNGSVKSIALKEVK